MPYRWRGTARFEAKVDETYAYGSTVRATVAPFSTGKLGCVMRLMGKLLEIDFEASTHGNISFLKLILTTH